MKTRIILISYIAAFALLSAFSLQDTNTNTSINVKCECTNCTCTDCKCENCSEGSGCACSMNSGITGCSSQGCCNEIKLDGAGGLTGDSTVTASALVCPVSGEEIPQGGGVQLEYYGKTYTFCCEGC
jgi:hypothetical protein